MHEATASLSELVKRAEQDGPQDITLHGRSVAVVRSRAAFERLTGQQGSLLAALDNGELVVDRDSSLTRAVSL